MATAAKAGPIEKLEPWDMKSGFASMSEMAPAILFVFGGATVLFFGLPKLYGSKIPGTFDPEWKKAQLIREHAKVGGAEGRGGLSGAGRTSLGRQGGPARRRARCPPCRGQLRLPQAERDGSSLRTASLASPSANTGLESRPALHLVRRSARPHRASPSGGTPSRECRGRVSWQPCIYRPRLGARNSGGVGVGMDCFCDGLCGTA